MTHPSPSTDFEEAHAALQAEGFSIDHSERLIPGVKALLVNPDTHEAASILEDEDGILILRRGNVALEAPPVSIPVSDYLKTRGPTP